MSNVYIPKPKPTLHEFQGPTFPPYPLFHFSQVCYPMYEQMKLQQSFSYQGAKI